MEDTLTDVARAEHEKPLLPNFEFSQDPPQVCVPGDCDQFCKNSKPPCSSGYCQNHICVCKDCGSALACEELK